ncbi:MAG TPA: hypothetical protein PLX89_20745 [Verrucomicrobiota bacterium]|nr:hypothetical protein [Verrucomicrobiales bacterium]HRI15432.1 hypothetical protein [Verrucomicrobiota bacterium]
MSSPSDPAPLGPHPVGLPSPERTLRRLFLTLFLRGRSARGLKKDNAPQLVGRKLALTLILYALLGLLALVFLRKPVFALAVYLHGMTLVFLGMFVAASAGEIPFNREEADILLHRPVTPRALLWAKIGVLVQVSLWLAGAFNFFGLFIGTAAPDGGWMFPFAHALSTVIGALFCTGCVVLLYQLCLRWFGRERLDGLMTTAQMLVAITAVLGGQVVPQILIHFEGNLSFGVGSWWVFLLPPAWLAGIDDALAGSGARSSWVLAAVGLTATAIVLGLAFGRLAGDYEKGLQMLNEAAPTRTRGRPGRRPLDYLVKIPPLRWWLRDPVARASFRLTAAYLVRDREVKLRVYPGLAPMLVMPLIFLIPHRNSGSGFNAFGVCFTGAYLGLVPLLALQMVTFSQQWSASDIFRAAPVSGPAALCHGARQAVLLLVTLPVIILFALVAWAFVGATSDLALLLPGLIALPVYALIPCLGGNAVPFSVPSEEAKSASRGLSMIGVMVVSMAGAGVALWAWSSGWFEWFLLGESVAVIGLYIGMRRAVQSARWSSME